MFRAIWLIQRPFATLAIPATSTRRVDSSMKNSAMYRCKPREVHTSTVKKSDAAPETVKKRALMKKKAKKAKANEGKKKCALFKPVRGGFDHAGTAGANRFRFSGRLARSLAPGAYRLTGKASASSRTADFRVVR